MRVFIFSAVVAALACGICHAQTVSSAAAVSTPTAQTVAGINTISTAAPAAVSQPSADNEAKARAEQEEELRQEREKSSYEKLILKGDLETSEMAKLPLYTKALRKWRPGYGKKVKGQIYERRGAVYAKMREWSKSSSDLNAAIALNPKALDAIKLLSRVYQMQGKCTSAEKEVSRALKLAGKGEHAELYYQRALINGLCLKNNDKAFSDFDMVIKTAYPAKHAEIMRKSFLNRGVLYCLRGNSAEGMADIGEAKMMGSAGSRDYLAAQGSCQFLQDAFTAAKTEYEAYLNPGDDDSYSPPENNITAEVYCRRGQVLLNDSMTESALDDFTKCIDLKIPRLDVNRPSNENLFDSSECYYQRARLYENANETLFAMQDYDRACQMGNRPACARRKAMPQPDLGLQ